MAKIVHCRALTPPSLYIWKLSLGMLPFRNLLDIFLVAVLNSEFLDIIWGHGREYFMSFSADRTTHKEKQMGWRKGSWVRIICVLDLVIAHAGAICGLAMAVEITGTGHSVEWNQARSLLTTVDHFLFPLSPCCWNETPCPWESASIEPWPGASLVSHWVSRGDISARRRL